MARRESSKDFFELLSKVKSCTNTKVMQGAKQMRAKKGAAQTSGAYQQSEEA
jgi:hypothetical protein